MTPFLVGVLLDNGTQGGGGNILTQISGFEAAKERCFCWPNNERSVSSWHSHANAINVAVFLFVIKINATQLGRN